MGHEAQGIGEKVVSLATGGAGLKLLSLRKQSKNRRQDRRRYALAFAKKLQN
jgi:hypothetical protein